MDKNIVKLWYERKDKIELLFRAEHPDDYIDVVKNVISVLTTDEYEFMPDPERIHLIDDGDYQGTLVFVIANKGFQPSEYWYVKVSYGSCSGCDTLKGIRNCIDDKPTDDEVNQYMTLALHIVQGLKRMGDE